MADQIKILDIQRMSTEDGPGLRTTVFLKGCNLSCHWCHNPESIDIKPVLNWYKSKCMGCNICTSICPCHVISRNASGIQFERSKCVGCSLCVKACPQCAIELKGINHSIDYIVDELVKDQAYFGPEGGITFSGGEPVLQLEALVAITKKLKERGIASIAIDTAGHYQWEWLAKILPSIDLVLFDLKLFNDHASKEWTGVTTELIKNNYVNLIQNKKRVWVRTPIIPSATATKENIESIAQFIQQSGLPERWELCAFNNLPVDKYERLDKKWKFENFPPMKRHEMETLITIAKKYVPCATWTGTVSE